MMLFYEELLREGAADKADRIEDTAMGASCVLSGGENVQKAVEQLRRL